MITKPNKVAENSQNALSENTYGLRSNVLLLCNRYLLPGVICTSIIIGIDTYYIVLSRLPHMGYN
jgi:hypothetical protein